MAKPTKLPEWDSAESNSTEPDAAHKLDGWLAPGGVPEKPPFQSFNFWQNNVWKWLDEINIKGILGYDALTDYIASLSYAIGSDGKRYHCLINNGPSSSVVNPVGDSTGTWRQLPEDFAGRNALINGAMLHAQRGASGSALFDAATIPLNSDDTYLLDRWLLLSDGNDIVDVSQSTDAPDGSLLSCSLDVETINLKFGILQIIEQKNCQHMIGENVSLSFEAQVTDITKLDNIKVMVLSWNGAADIPTSDIISAWNAEDTTPALVANWVAENTPANLGVTASWVKYKIENIAIDTAATKNIGVFIWSDGFCDTLGTILRITNVQLEKNPIASDFEWQDDLPFCEQYYQKSYKQEVIPGTATTDGMTRFYLNFVNSSDHTIDYTTYLSIPMRVVPTVALYDSAGNLGKVTMAAGDNIAGAAGFIGQKSFRPSAANGAAATARLLQYHWVAEAELGV